MYFLSSYCVLWTVVSTNCIQQMYILRETWKGVRKIKNMYYPHQGTIGGIHWDPYTLSIRISRVPISITVMMTAPHVRNQTCYHDTVAPSACQILPTRSYTNIQGACPERPAPCVFHCLNLQLAIISTTLILKPGIVGLRRLCRESWNYIGGYPIKHRGVAGSTKKWELWTWTDAAEPKVRKRVRVQLEPGTTYPDLAFPCAARLAHGDTTCPNNCHMRRL